MPKRMTKGKMEATTSAPLTLPPVVDKRQAVDKLLDVLFELAVKGDLSAAKLYLDFSLKLGLENLSGITADEALKLLNQE